MAVGLIGWERFLKDGQWIALPAGLAKFLHTNAREIGASFDFLQQPPISMTNGGAAPDADGYGVHQRRNFGTPENPTNWGYLEDWMAAISALNAYGCQSLADFVTIALYSPNGGPGIFDYLGADGKTRNGAGATTPGWFMSANDEETIPPFCKNDTVMGGPSAIMNFGGCNISMEHSNPAGVTVRDAVAYLRFLKERTGIAGCRIDDAKGQWAPGLIDIMESQPDLLYWIEYYDGNPGDEEKAGAMLKWLASVEDFTGHYRFQDACNSYDARKFVAGGWGFSELNPGHAIQVIETPDSASETGPGYSIGNQIVFNKAIAYAVAMTLPNRMVLVYGGDYFPASVWKGGYGLKPLIDNLCWINRMFAFGNCYQRWVDQDVLALERDGNGGAIGWSGGLITIINFNTLAARTVTIQTVHPEGTWLHDYTGHNEDVTVGAGGRATFTVRSNYYSNGQSYGCWSPGGVNKAYPTNIRTTTQSFIGDETLDIMPLCNGINGLPQRLYIQAGTRVRMALSAVLPANGVLVATVNLETTGEMVAMQQIGPVPKNYFGDARTTGWHTVSIEGFGLPAEGTNFQLDVTYTGAQS